MAKRIPTLTLVEMEKELGYKIDSSSYSDSDVIRLYSDVRPVALSAYERTKREFEEHKREREKQRLHGESQTTIEKVVTVYDFPHTITHEHVTVTFTRLSHIGIYSFAVNIQYNSLTLPLLFTEKEVARAMTVAKLPSETHRGLGPLFLKLPKELRHKIYIHALPQGVWVGEDTDSSSELNFTGGVGDASGFYFPLSSLSVLRINKQMRQEALPLAYRRTLFHFDDMDDLMKFLIAIGNIGRGNIESLELAWQSRTDLEYQWDKAPIPEKHSPSLPTLHVATCAQLLKQCRRLRFMRLYFEAELILDMLPDSYKADPGLCELCSIRGIERVEICDLAYEPLDQCDIVKWLKGAMESSKEG